MFDSFLVHIVISAFVFGILASGFKFYITLKGSLDFSYMAIVIFASYTAALCNIHRGTNILVSIGIAFVLSLGFTFLILYLSGKLSDVYFVIGSLALYILIYQLAFNLEGITGGALGLSGMSRNVIGTMQVTSLSSYLVLAAGGGIFLFIVLYYFKKTYLYRLLQGRGENDLVISSLGIRITLYKFIMILLTTLLASVGGGLYSFYYLYIDPSTFWLGMLILLITIAFVSYKRNDWGVLFVSFIILFMYEYLRFFKFMDPSQIGYFREMIFGLIIMIVSFLVFKRTDFGREH